MKLLYQQDFRKVGNDRSGTEKQDELIDFIAEIALIGSNQCDTKLEAKNITMELFNSQVFKRPSSLLHIPIPSQTLPSIVSLLFLMYTVHCSK